MARMWIRQTDFHFRAGHLFFSGTEKPRSPSGYPSKFGNGAQDEGINSNEIGVFQDGLLTFELTD